MKWLRENPFVAGLLAITVVGVGALGYFLSQFMGEYTSASEEYAAAVQKLQNLQNRAPFPNDDNYKKTKELEDQYRKSLTTLQQDLAKMQIARETDVQPQQFQDALRKAVNEAKEKAQANNVALPANFFLGFNQFEGTLPDAAAAPVLSRQLKIISQLVGRLIDLKVQSIDELNVGEKRTAPGGGNQPPKPSDVQKFPFTIAFTADQGKFRVAFNAFMGAEQFMIIRALALQNTNPVGPPMGGGPGAGGTSATGTPSATGETSPDSEKGNLNVILGRELVRVVMKVDMIDFPAVPAPK